MAGITGWTPTPDTFDPAVHIDLVYTHIDSIEDDVATVGALPASGNWPGRTKFVTADKSLREWDGTAWRIILIPWTDFTPSLLSGTMTLGTGGSTLYAKYKVDNGEATARIGWQFGTASFSWNDPTWNYPIAQASWLSALAPIGTWHFADVSAGAAGRYWNTLFAGSGIRMTLAQITGASVQIAGQVTPNTPLQASDEMHLTVTYPI